MADTPNNGPPTPYTPPRGRSRYPSSLAHDNLRVPLHRRGTSRTYERLEDLLKEAGYKETRIFTPETERHREHQQGPEEREASGRVRSGVDSVVGFLAGLVSVQSDGERVDVKTSQNDRATHTSLVDPLMHRHRAELDISEYPIVCIENVQNLYHLFQIQLWHHHLRGLEQWATHSDIAVSPTADGHLMCPHLRPESTYVTSPLPPIFRGGDFCEVIHLYQRRRRVPLA
jgi:hypothetical protein